MKSLFLFLATGLFAFMTIGFLTGSEKFNPETKIQKNQVSADITFCDEKAIDVFELWFNKKDRNFKKSLKKAKNKFSECLKKPGGLTDRAWKDIKSDLTKKYGG